jgi:hypothetical protein
VKWKVPAVWNTPKLATGNAPDTPVCPVNTALFIDGREPAATNPVTLDRLGVPTQVIGNPPGIPLAI